MGYQDMIDNVMQLGFIESEEQADSAIKAVLGILISRMSDSDARLLTRQFPTPLSYDALRSHQANQLDISVGEYISQVSAQFGIHQEEARELVQNVLHDIKEFVDEDTLLEVEDHLPFEWTATLVRA